LALVADVQEGQILMMASQREVFKMEDDESQQLVYDAFETFMSGEPTGKSLLRHIVSGDGDTWAFIGRKGAHKTHSKTLLENILSWSPKT